LSGGLMNTGQDDGPDQPLRPATGPIVPETGA
jgi:hypothetical protein